MSAKYRVYWDNGAEACGTFPTVFETYKEAEAYAANWEREMNSADGIPDDEPERYTAEVIEVEG